MTNFTPIKGDEAKHWAEVRKRLLRPDLDPWDYNGYETSPFTDTSWQIVPIPERFCAPEVYGAESGGWPQRGDLPEITAYTDPLIWCLTARGCKEVIITNDWHQPAKIKPGKDPALYVCCDVALNTMQDARYFSYKEHFEGVEGMYANFHMAFDASGEWAVVDGVEFHHLLGGTPDFIKQYCEAAGGEDYVRAWYYHFDLWSMKDYPPEYIYNLCGWPPPVPPEGGLWFNSGGDIDWTPMFGDRIKSCGPDVTDPDKF